MNLILLINEGMKYHIKHDYFTFYVKQKFNDEIELKRILLNAKYS